MTYLYIALVVLSFIYWKAQNRKYKKKKEVLVNLGLTCPNTNQKEKKPATFKQRKNKLILKHYDPSITTHNFTNKELTALSKVFLDGDDCFLMADYEPNGFFEKVIQDYNKNSLVIYNSKIESYDFLKNKPKVIKKYEFWVAKTITDKDLVYDLKNTQGIVIYGFTGSGKTRFANIIRWFTLDYCSKEYIFTKTKTDFFNSPQTEFIQKDDEEKILKTLLSVKNDVLKKQRDLEACGLKNVYEAEEDLTFLIFDECHSYLKNNSSLNKEQKNIRTQIIEIVDFLINQARSSGFYCIFILPSAERDMTDVQLRNCAFTFSSKIPSETVSQNLFHSAIASDLPRKQGLFVGTDGFKVDVFQTPKLEFRNDFNK